MPYKDHHTLFGKLFGWFGDLLHDMFKNANHDALSIAIEITNAIKTGLDLGFLDKLTTLTTTTLDDNVLATLKAKIPLLLADELALKSINESTSLADAQNIMAIIVDSFGGLPDAKKEKFYTTIAAQIYQLIVQVQDGKDVTFGQAAALVETAYQAYLESKADDQP